MKILICGDRNWNDFITVYTILREYQNIATLVVHGGVRGADSLAGDAAEALRIPVKTYPADWSKHGSSAGPIRNITMFNETNPDLVIAFHNDLASSKGTKHMVEYARSLGARVILVDSKSQVTEFIRLKV